MPALYGFHLLDLAMWNPTARNIVRAVVYPAKQLGYASLMGAFVIYLYTLVNFGLLSDSFELQECNVLWQCLLTTINQGLRMGGGIAEYYNEADLQAEPLLTWVWRSIFDFSFFVVLIVILLNIIFGIIIDTFSDLRGQKAEHDETFATHCFICNLPAATFDRETARGYKYHYKVCLLSVLLWL